MDLTSTADLFDLFRASQPGQGAMAVQEERLREIATSRQIPLYQRDPQDLEKKLSQLSQKDRAYVLSRLSQGLPAVTETASGLSRQVWFPVKLAEPTPKAVLATQAARGTIATQTNLHASRSRLHTLLDSRQSGSDALLSVVGGAYGTSVGR